MSEPYSRLDHLSEGDLVLAVGEGLVALYPIMKRLEFPDDDGLCDTYEFDEIQTGLWRAFVEYSLYYRNEKVLANLPRLNRGHSDGDDGPFDGYIEATFPGESAKYRFLGFVGDRSLGPEPFNAFEGLDLIAGERSVRGWEGASFRWVRS